MATASDSDFGLWSADIERQRPLQRVVCGLEARSGKTCDDASVRMLRRADRFCSNASGAKRSDRCSTRISCNQRPPTLDKIGQRGRINSSGRGKTDSIGGKCLRVKVAPPGVEGDQKGAVVPLPALNGRRDRLQRCHANTRKIGGKGNAARCSQPHAQAGKGSGTDSNSNQVQITKA